MTSPIKAVIAGVLTGLTALALSLLFSSGADAKTLRVPVVKPPVDGVMIQTGWHLYEELDNILVLFCVQDEPNATMACMIYVSTDKGSGLTMVSGVKPSGAQL